MAQRGPARPWLTLLDPATWLVLSSGAQLGTHHGRGAQGLEGKGRAGKGGGEVQPVVLSPWHVWGAAILSRALGMGGNTFQCTPDMAGLRRATPVQTTPTCGFSRGRWSTSIVPMPSSSLPQRCF